MYRLKLPALRGLVDLELFEPQAHCLLNGAASVQHTPDSVREALVHLGEQGWFIADPPSLDMDLQASLELLANPLLRITTVRDSVGGERRRMVTDSDYAGAVSYVSDGSSLMLSDVQSLEEVVTGVTHAILGSQQVTIRGSEFSLPAAWAGVLSATYPSAFEGRLTAELIEQWTAQVGENSDRKEAEAMLHALERSGWLRATSNGAGTEYGLSDEGLDKVRAVVPTDRVHLSVGVLGARQWQPVEHIFHRHGASLWHLVHSVEIAESAGVRASTNAAGMPYIHYRPCDRAMLRSTILGALGHP